MRLYDGLVLLSGLWMIRISIYTWSVGWEQANSLFSFSLFALVFSIHLATTKRQWFVQMLLGFSLALLFFIGLSSVFHIAWIESYLAPFMDFGRKLTGYASFGKLDLTFVALGHLVIAAMFGDGDGSTGSIFSEDTDEQAISLTETQEQSGASPQDQTDEDIQHNTDADEGEWFFECW
ncbi:MAG TPA: hypothetical protein DCE42_29865 [Myxococcales bacterium]|nr:hypothetical protein [Deltaproteobacteria bacterium]HAA58999.1 hypothetical protein [Myxococcales bacterium]|tara:strand:+ start:3013 stop:3546 length:534 start_codon:yes stop_codon:yes gene_type:complete